MIPPEDDPDMINLYLDPSTERLATLTLEEYLRRITRLCLVLF